MDIPLTQRRTDEFDDRNVVLQLALGASAFGDALDELLSHYGVSSPSALPSTLSPQDEEVVFFLLGLVALRRQFQAILERARLEPSPSRWPDRDDEHRSVHGDLLR